MKIFKRAFALLFAFALLLPSLSGCKFGEGYYLTVYNWADYIDESVLDRFADYYKKVDPNFKGITYETCDAPETMYTKFAKSGEPWDVACNADYLEGKLLRRGDLQPFPVERMPNYQQYVSEYIKEQYEIIQDSAMKDYSHEGVEVRDGKVQGTYGIGYMWGTMGIVYNVADANRAGGAEALFKDWELMWNPDFNNRVYMKNSVRESYIVGTLQANNEKLTRELNRMKAGEISGDDYNRTLREVLGTVDAASIEAAKQELIDQQDKVSVKYDVDYDKIAMSQGKASLDYCWAGDGYKALVMGAEEPSKVVLSYGVPETGTNLFFDGWFLSSKLEKDSPRYNASVAFVDYLCLPEQAKLNMTEIGYVSATAGTEMLEWGAENWRLASEGGTDEAGDVFEKIIFDDALKNKGDNLDVRYFFGDKVIDDYIAAHGGPPKLNPIQYPDDREMYKFAVVSTYSNEQTDALIDMWAQVKTGDFPTVQIIMFAVIVAAFLGFAVYKFSQKAKNKKSAAKVKTKRNYNRIR